MKMGNRDESVYNILEGMKARRKDTSYLKEGFRILIQNEAFESLCDFYKLLEGQEQEIGKLKFYYAFALAKLGNYTDALHILEQNGGIELEDIREGEGSIQELWEEATEIVRGTVTAVPYIYNFRTSQ